MCLNVSVQKLKQQDRIYKWKNHFEKEELGEMKHVFVSQVGKAKMEKKRKVKSTGLNGKRKL